MKETDLVHELIIAKEDEIMMIGPAALVAGAAENVLPGEHRVI